MTDYIYFRYCKNTDDEYRNQVKTTVESFQKKIKKNKDFLNGFTFHVCNSYKDLGNRSPLTKYVSEHSKEFMYTGGMTVSKIENQDKSEIIVKTSSPTIFNFERNKKVSDVSQATMHEIGHQFDTTFGSCDLKLIEKVKKLPLWTDEPGTDEEEELFDKYHHSKDLSDKPEFKAAWKIDAQNLGNSSLSNTLFKHRYFEYWPYDIDVTDGVTDKEVEQSDTARSEIFAQLFSYAMGEDDGAKDIITEKYPNSYKIVKLYIKQYFGIDAK